MTTIIDDVGTGVLGAGTAELLLGSGTTAAGQALVVPDKANCLIEVLPYQAGNAVVTASESLNTSFRIASDDISTCIPKIFQLPVVMGGLGATSTHIVPTLQAFKCNTPLKGGERINYYANPITATTTATLVGASVIYGQSGAQGVEQFYNRVTNSTITAPAANARNTTGTYALTGASAINFIQPHYGSVVMTAAQAVVGVAEIQSSDFIDPLPFRAPIQPIGGILGATSSAGLSNAIKYALAEPIAVRSAGQSVINTFYTARVVQTGNCNFGVTFGYVK